MAGALCAIPFIGALALLVGAVAMSADSCWPTTGMIVAGAGFALACGAKDIAIARWERSRWPGA